MAAFLAALLFLSLICGLVGAIEIHRRDFPPHFLFGASSSAFQYEGAASEGGRTPSIWDTFASDPGNIVDGSNASVTVDQYHRFEEDVLLVKKMGWDSYRFSISWSRFLSADGRINPQGAAHYNHLINSLLRHGIQPFVTIYHWDLPQELEDAFGGWRGREIVKHFLRYAESCFDVFGDRVKFWLTFNEPHMFVSGGFAHGKYAPGRCSGCKNGGDSSTEPYIAGHNVLLAHAAAVQLYRSKYQAAQRGRIGITLDSFWFEPLTDSPADVAAALRALDFELGWFLHPVVYGDYPRTMREAVKWRLPSFSLKESLSLVNSTDFIGINHYTSRYVRDNPGGAGATNAGFDMDQQIAKSAASKNGTYIGSQGPTGWLYAVPWGFYSLLKYMKDNYKNPVIIVTENGADQSNTQTVDLEDERRIEYHIEYLESLLKARRDGVDVRGYFVWSLLDNWEWNNGFSIRFGLHFVDYPSLQRYPKRSALWFKEFLSRRIRSSSSSSSSNSSSSSSSSSRSSSVQSSSSSSVQSSSSSSRSSSVQVE